METTTPSKLESQDEMGRLEKARIEFNARLMPQLSRCCS